MRAVHLEGFGVIGSLLGYHLDRAGVPWTWSDTDESVTAWRACTGAIFPTGKPEDQIGLGLWREWATLPHLAFHVERCTWWYTSLAPPHGAPGRHEEQVGPLRRLQTGSLHFNAQTFVPWARHAFRRCRERTEPHGAERVVAHGFSRRLDHVVWGWNVRVKLDGEPALLDRALRPAVYCREGRFVMAYAYPVPGEPWWYAGSSLIVQRVPRPLLVPRKFARWKEQFERLTGGLLRVAEVGAETVGWRPAAADDDQELVRRIDGVLHVRPLWHNGVRLAPLVVSEVLLQLGIGRDRRVIAR